MATYEEMFDSWTVRLKAMSAEERRALHHALADFYAPEPMPGNQSFSLKDVYVEIGPPAVATPMELGAAGPSDYKMRRKLRLVKGQPADVTAATSAPSEIAVSDRLNDVTSKA
jgi:hypothetical protein